MKRIGTVIGLQADKIDEYKTLHANVWPDVLDMISACHIKNYSIFLREPENLLFSYFEYHGEDMARMAEDEATQKWWKLTDPCQQALASRNEGEWWASMEGVFHHD